MNCADAQDQILSRLEGLLSDADGQALDAHLAECDACAHFELAQVDLDRRLADALPPVTLGEDVRQAVRARIAAPSSQTWFEMMPDYAHLIGCAGAIALAVILLPAYAWTVVSIGASVAALTYVGQTMLADTLATMDQGRPRGGGKLSLEHAQRPAPLDETVLVARRGLHQVSPQLPVAAR